MKPSKEAMEAAGPLSAKLWARYMISGDVPLEYEMRTAIASAIDAFASTAVKREREECAKVCDDNADADHNGECFIPNQAMRLAAEIRSRAATERKE